MVRLEVQPEELLEGLLVEHRVVRQVMVAEQQVQAVAPLVMAVERLGLREEPLVERGAVRLQEIVQLVLQHLRRLLSLLAHQLRLKENLLDQLVPVFQLLNLEVPNLPLLRTLLQHKAPLSQILQLEPVIPPLVRLRILPPLLGRRQPLSQLLVNLMQTVDQTHCLLE